MEFVCYIIDVVYNGVGGWVFVCIGVVEYDLFNCVVFDDYYIGVVFELF